MLFDSHVHTEFSVDGKAELKEYLRAAKEQKIGITITDHIDYINPRNYDSQPSLFDCKKLFDSFLPLRCDTFRIGVELGMEPCVAEKNCDLVKSQPWDYVLGSMHLLGGAAYGELDYPAADIPKIYAQYFVEYTDALRLHDCVDAVAHIDGICRYNNHPDNNLTLGNWVRTAPCLIAVYYEQSKIDNSIFDAEMKHTQAIGAAIQNILLAAHSVGLGTCWIGEILKNQDRVNDLLVIPQDLKLMAVITLGYPGKAAKSRRKSLYENILSWV